MIKGFALSHLGELEQARIRIEHGRRLAGELGDLDGVALSLGYSVVRAYLTGEPEEALSYGQRMLEIAGQIGGAFATAGAWHWLGLAEQLRGRWHNAIEALERSEQIAKGTQTASVLEPFRLAVLAESHLGLGDVERARQLADEGVARAREQRHHPNELQTRLALARALLAPRDPAMHSRIGTVLAEALESARVTSARGTEPLIHLELAELARQRGDEGLRHNELRAGHELFLRNGATAHAERVARELAVRAAS
jgi:tetratricopeptide (TPR) repeat protein